ncbi:MAG: hypothetical protein K6G27_03610 [Lachnospiraceae bacterium]|nr:hypothetical protein [Lachnospiraceae bacterium]
MGEIIPFKKLINKKTVQHGFLDFDKIDHYLDMLDIQRGVLTELHILTERFLRDLGFQPELFELDDNTIRRSISADLVEYMEGGEESLDVCYKATIDGVEYRTLASSMADGENVQMDIDFFKFADGEWLSYMGNDSWSRGPGADFF